MSDRPKFTKAQEVFMSEYLKCFNGTEAYSRAYPKAKRDSARANASELLAKTSIKDEIAARLAQIHMSADEALKRLADMARGDITAYLSPIGMVELDKIKESGHGHIVKRIKQKTITKIGKGEKDEDTEVHETEIELYPADAAIRDILKMHGKYIERQDITSNGQTIQVTIKGLDE